ncbi:MAG: methyltransferase family protein [Promethearchaeota archaeon]
MSDKKGVKILKEKVPDLQTSRGKILAAAYILVAFSGCLLFFLWIDSLVWYGPLVSQLSMALIGTAFSIAHFRTAARYRETYGDSAYRYHFYHYVIPILVTWYACCFHPLFVGGPELLHLWIAIFIGVLLLLMTILTEVQIEKSGFDVTTHGLDIFTIFPEETPPVHGEIYSFIRHPLYFSLLCLSLCLAFFRNNLMAVLVALIFLIPIVAAIYLEDRELVERYGDVHRDYIKRTAAIIPLKRPLGFLRLMVQFKQEQKDGEIEQD